MTDTAPVPDPYREVTRAALLKDRLRQQFPMLRDVLVHLESYPHEHEG